MGGGAPKPDKNIGVAAMKSAETGEAMLNWMKGQAEITNSWAAQDRARYQDTFVPLQDQFIADAGEHRQQPHLRLRQDGQEPGHAEHSRRPALTR